MLRLTDDRENRCFSRKGSASFWASSLLVLVSILILSAASAGLLENCLSNYRCTAKDVGITAIKINAVKDGCISLTDSAKINITVVLQSNQPDRYDVGFFLATEGGDANNGAVNGCFHEALFPLKSPTNTSPTVAEATSGIGPYWDKEGNGDLCGDIDSSVNGGLYDRRLVIGDVSSGSTTAADVTVRCADNYLVNGNPGQNGYADFGWMASWDNNTQGLCTSLAQVVPGTTSKCQLGKTDSAVTGNPIPIGIPNLGLTINCTPDLIYPKSPNTAERTVQCTVTYTNIPQPWGRRTTSSFTSPIPPRASTRVRCRISSRQRAILLQTCLQAGISCLPPAVLPPRD